MKESTERIIKIGFTRNPRRIFNEIEQITARMIRDGWELRDSVMEEGLENIHLFFEREIGETLYSPENEG
jgi:hypothetical protein